MYRTHFGVWYFLISFCNSNCCGDRKTILSRITSIWILNLDSCKACSCFRTIMISTTFILRMSYRLDIPTRLSLIISQVFQWFCHNGRKINVMNFNNANVRTSGQWLLIFAIGIIILSQFFETRIILFVPAWNMMRMHQLVIHHQHHHQQIMINHH